MDLTEGTFKEKNDRAKRMMLWFGIISLIMSFAVKFENQHLIMKPITYIIIALLFGLNFGYGQDLNSFFKEANYFFENHVSEGKVNYSKIKSNTDQLNNLVKVIGNLKVSGSDSNTQQAFLINAYNVLVIKGIIDHYPINSPLDKVGFFDKTTYKVSGESLTLNDIENKKLRAAFDDPRFHFVLVCGALGCPPLISAAYMPNSLNEQLNTQTKLALNNPEFIKVKKNKVQLSEIFKWYKEDFVKNGDEIVFINKYRKTPIDTKSKISYYTYNWNLNNN